MPGAGETAHVRRLFVDRSRCALEVSPAPHRVPMSLVSGRRAVVAHEAANPSAGGCGDEDQVGRAGGMPIAIPAPQVGRPRAAPASRGCAVPPSELVVRHLKSRVIERLSWVYGWRNEPPGARAAERRRTR